MTINRILAAVIAMVLLLPFSIRGQNTDGPDATQQLWLDFNPSWSLSDRVAINSKFGFKTIFPNAWYKFYASGEVSYDVPKLMLKSLQYHEQVYAGLDMYYIVNSQLENVFELSFFQGYTLKWPNRKYIELKHNVELGERFQWGVVEGNYSFGLNLSYAGSFTWKFHGDVVDFGQGFYLVCTFKFWWNLISATVFNDVARVTPGIGYQINDQWKTAFLVGWNYTRNLTSERFSTNSVIFRLRAYYTIN